MTILFSLWKHALKKFSRFNAMYYRRKKKLIKPKCFSKERFLFGTSRLNNKKGLIYTENKPSGRLYKMCDPFFHEWVPSHSVIKRIPARLLYCHFIHHRGCMLEGWPWSACSHLSIRNMAVGHDLYSGSLLTDETVTSAVARYTTTAIILIDAFTCVRVWTAKLIVVWVTPR